MSNAPQSTGPRARAVWRCAGRVPTLYWPVLTGMPVLFWAITILQCIGLARMLAATTPDLRAWVGSPLARAAYLPALTGAVALTLTWATARGWLHAHNARATVGAEGVVVRDWLGREVLVEWERLTCVALRRSVPWCRRYVVLGTGPDSELRLTDRLDDPEALAEVVAARIGGGETRQRSSSARPTARATTLALGPPRQAQGDRRDRDLRVRRRVEDHRCAAREGGWHRDRGVPVHA